MTLLYTHPSGFQHVTPPSHPEQVARLEAVLAALEGMDLDRREAPEAPDDEILRCHPASYLSLVRRKLPDQGWTMLDADTYLSPGSLAAARHAVGGVCAAVDAVLAGQAPNAFVAMRPPGHHTERARAMGFCIFNAIAIGALRALDHHGLDRVAVLDFDVHHGNGTQDLLWNEPRALFASTHQHPLYPGTGAAGERGAHGQILNVPLQAGTGGDPARAAWRGICDRVLAWRPQWFDGLGRVYKTATSGSTSKQADAITIQMAYDARGNLIYRPRWSRSWKAAMIWPPWAARCAPMSRFYGRRRHDRNRNTLLRGGDARAGGHRRQA
nr:histone deacetylase family protein [Paracoccus mutanolyticus]